MDTLNRRGCWVTSRILLLPMVSLVLLFSAQHVVAFEGDYIWDERFKASLAKAESGRAKDQYTVGDMYFRGRGTAVNPSEALRWFLRAAKQGHRKSAYKAGYLYLYNEELSPSASPKKGIPWIKKAAAAGYAPAQYELGRLYFSGDVIKRSESQALKWLGRAKAANYEPAGKAFEQIVKRLVKAQNVFPKRVKPKTKASQQLVAERELPDPKGIILQSNWGSTDGPSTFLPSKLTHCRESPKGIECLSSKLDMQLASTHVVYRTSTKITNINPDGQFRLAYANTMLSTDAKSTGEAAAVKANWSRNEQVLDCSLVAGRTISCAQGTDKQYRFFGRY